MNLLRPLIASLLCSLALNALAAVDANQASRADLETVKGVGPGLSGKIIEARKAGNFKDWNDLVDRVGGIGPGNASKFSGAGLTVGGAAYAGGATVAAAKPGKGGGTAAAKPVKAAKAEAGRDAGSPAR